MAVEAHEELKRRNPSKKLDDAKFFTTAEVYNYSLNDGLEFPIGDKTINYFANGFDSLINFGFKTDVKKDYETLFSGYSAQLHGVLEGYSVLNYVDSHDDEESLDRAR